MSLDKSLVVKNKLQRSRNVLKRDERIEKLLEDERWSEGDSVFGLPKVTIVKIKRVKTKKKKAEGEEETEAGAAEAEVSTE